MHSPSALLHGLAGEEFAKAWSWERSCYEVRWERLAGYVKNKLESEKHPAGGAPEAPLIQVPQDAGSRGVAGRDRDPVVASFPAERFDKVVLEVELEPDEVYETGRVRVLNGIGDTIQDVEAKTGGRPVRFELEPKTYALRAVAEGYEEGRTDEPVDLYAKDPTNRSISLRSHEGTCRGRCRRARTGRRRRAGSFLDAGRAGVVGNRSARHRAEARPGHVVAEAADRLAFVEVRDNTGAVKAEALHRIDQELDPGFYQLRIVTPGRPGNRCRSQFAGRGRTRHRSSRLHLRTMSGRWRRLRARKSIPTASLL